MGDLSKTTLFGIPYAGGSAAAIYGRWARLLPSSIKVAPLELAGHGRRMTEPFSASLDEVIADLLVTVTPAVRTGPYAIYGHSMGATIAYELVKALDSVGLPPPLALFLSGRNPPHYSYPQRNLHVLDDETFLEEIRKLGGTPDGFFEMKDLVKAFLPILRNDYRIIELYRSAAPLHVTSAGIIFFHSDSDILVNEPEIFEWSRYTRGSSSVRKFRGGHFFINDYQEDICKVIEVTLAGAIANLGRLKVC